MPQEQGSGNSQPRAGVTWTAFKHSHETHPYLICFYYHYALASLNKINKEN